VLAARRRVIAVLRRRAMIGASDSVVERMWVERTCCFDQGDETTRSGDVDMDSCYIRVPL